MNDVREKTTTEKIEDAMASLFVELNHYGNDTECVTAITSYVTRQHRTLQQNFVRTVNAFIHSYAKATSDGRNDASVKWCQKIREIDNTDGCYFPFV